MWNIRFVKDGPSSAVPKTPELNVEQSADGYAWIGIRADGYSDYTYGPVVYDTHGRRLNGENCGFRVYADGDLVMFTPEMYEGLAESIDVLKLGQEYGTSWLSTSDFFHRYVIMPLPQDKIEVRTVYIDDKGERQSEPAVYEVERSGIGSVEADLSEAIKVEYFDLSGREVTPSASGCYIRRTTYRNGRILNEKVVLRP